MWKRVPSEPDYEVSDVGDVRHSERVLRQATTNDGYRVVRIGKRSRSVHRLVAEAFIGPADGRLVHHCDGNRTNNAAENLIYVTELEHCSLHPRKAKGRAYVIVSKATQFRLRQVAAKLGVDDSELAEQVLKAALDKVSDTAHRKGSPPTRNERATLSSAAGGERVVPPHLTPPAAPSSPPAETTDYCNHEHPLQPGVVMQSYRRPCPVHDHADAIDDLIDELLED